MKLEHLPWLASRSAGLVAFALVSATVVLGLAMSTHLVSGRHRVAVRGFHEPLALAALAATALHGVLLLFDGWLKAEPLQLLVPFTLSPAPLFTGLGVLAGYALVLFAVSFYVRRYLPAGQWRRIHRAAPVVWALGAVHALGAGSDAGGVVMQAILALTAVAVLGLLATRLRGQAPERERAKTHPAPERDSAPTARERGLAPERGCATTGRAVPLWSDVYPDVTRGVSN